MEDLGGILNYRCTSCRDDLDESAFQMVPATNGKRYRRSTCGHCTYLKYGRYQKKRVPIEPVRKFLQELILHCGSERAAARRLGVDHPTVRLWLGKQKRYYKGRTVAQRSMSRESARLVLFTLQEVRRG